MKSTKQYGNSPHATGRTAALDKHAGPVERDKDHHSQMRMVDAKEDHLKSKGNMEQHAKPNASQKLSDKVPYKHQSHWSGSKNEIKHVVGDGTVEGHPGRDTVHPDDFGGAMHPGEYHRSGNVMEVKRPDIDGDYDAGKSKSHIKKAFEPNNSMGSSKSSYDKFKE